MRPKRRPMVGHKVQRTVMLREELDDWITQMQARAGGWTCSGVIEYCVEKTMQLEQNEKRGDLILEALARIEDGINRLRDFHDYELWERFEAEPRESYEDWLNAMEERARQ